jgi:hypothetical protein
MKYMRITCARGVLGYVKIKLSLGLTKYHAMKTVGEWNYSFTPQPLLSRGRSLLCPLDRRMGGP